MLVAEVLVGFGKTQRRIATLQKGDMVAAAQITIAPLHHADLETGHVTLTDLLHMTRQLPRRRIIFAAGGDQCAQLVRHFLLRRNAFREQAYLRVVDPAVVAARTADDVVGKHPGDIELVLLCHFGPVR